VTARFSHEPTWHWVRGLFKAHRFNGLRFHIFAVAFTINGVASLSASALGLAGGG
jgi:hypothetical protein